MTSTFLFHDTFRVQALVSLFCSISDRLYKFRPYDCPAASRIQMKSFQSVIIRNNCWFSDKLRHKRCLRIFINLCRRSHLLDSSFCCVIVFCFDVLLDVFIYQFCMRFHDGLCNRLYGRWYFPYFSSKKSCFSSVLPCLSLLFFSFRENVYTVIFPLFVSFFYVCFYSSFCNYLYFPANVYKL